MDNHSNEHILDSNIHPSFLDSMDVDIVVNENSEVWVLYTEKLPGFLSWAELDPETKTISFLMNDGKIMDLGMVLHPKIFEKASQAEEISLLQVKDKKYLDFYKIPLLVNHHSVV